ncbi:alpha/beta hydrolase [candidate division KSB1 bacterium]|nr:alpha/beta hydrolase [candidate division KSB1 bacterium]
MKLLISKRLLVFTLVLLLLIVSYFYFDSKSQELDAEARSLVTGKFVKLPDGIVHYDLANPLDGKTVVLIHGFSVPYFIWDRNFEALTQADFRVLRFDLYGRGYSDRPNVAYNPDFFDRQLVNLLAALEIKGLVDLVGISMGSMIAATFTDRHPERVRKLCLIDPGGFPVKVPFTGKLARLPVLGEFIMNVFGESTLIAMQKKDFYRTEQCPDEYLEKYRAPMKFKGFKRAILSSLRNMPLNDMVETYERVGKQQRPVLLIWGREDQTTPFANSEQARRALPQAEFHAIDEAGHVPHYERPEIVNPVLVDFLMR